MRCRVTNADGRCIDLLSSNPPSAQPVKLEPGGLYKIVFKTKDYFDRAGKATFYPWVEVSASKSTSWMRENDALSDTLRSDQPR